ncbi:hypothetical protein [Rhodococcus opacus]|uniref:Uncharacterized protein n=1 Tax=Rhodococcus opacus TaxID=37919 RepID=A0A2S8ICS9_RHOOP|nr:hypothetical protein [Rhodococcus opacus]PQP12525.1 hypothetical protein C5613_42795 [Rhodococcus opacus]
MGVLLDTAPTAAFETVGITVAVVTAPRPGHTLAPRGGRRSSPDKTNVPTRPTGVSAPVQQLRTA